MRFRLFEERRAWGPATIEVSTPRHLKGAVEAPVEASKSRSQGFRDLPKYLANATGLPKGTVRRCAPFQDAMNEGAIIPLPFDFWLKVSGGGKEIEWETSGAEVDLGAPPISVMDPGQTKGITDRIIIKVGTPYHARTKPGTSLLVVEPLNRFAPFRVVSGIIDTDLAPAPITPMIYWDGPDGEYVFRAGQPLAQLIALPRVRGRTKLAYPTHSNLSKRINWMVRAKLQGGWYWENVRASRLYKGAP